MEQGHQSETALVVFTTLVPAAFGVCLMGLVAGVAGGASATPVVLPAAALLLATVGMIASVFHLAKPLRAPYSLRNLRSSWLSREIAGVSVFWALVALWCVCAGGVLPLADAAAGAAALVACALAAVAGFALMFVIARAYRVATKPAWDGPECAWELVVAALGAGGACGAFCLLAGFVLEGSLAAIDPVPAVFAVILMACDALVTPVLHRRRIARLAAATDDRRAIASLARIRAGEARYRVLFRALAVCAAAPVVCVFVLWILPLVLASLIVLPAIVIAELVAHAKLRVLFYEAPANIPHAPRLGKQIPSR